MYRGDNSGDDIVVTIPCGSGRGGDHNGDHDGDRSGESADNRYDFGDDSG